jgi:hypothetical protein
MQGEAAYHIAAQRGVRFDMVVNATDALAQCLSQMAQFAAAHPGSMAAIEGPNEINNFGARYRGMSGAPAAVAFQDDLYAGVAADPALRGTPVYSYTMNAGARSITGYDFAAIHPYAVDGRPPRWFLDNNIGAVPPAKQFVVTETGYPTLPRQKDGVDGDAQAVYNLDMIFDAASADAAAVFLYELLDAYPDPSNDLVGNHFGLFDYGNNPKPIASALHNLTQILGGGPAHYSPGDLAFSIKGADSTANAMLLQKATSVFDLVIWDEQTIWNNTSHSEIAPVTHTEAIRFARLMATVDVYDPMSGTAPIAVYHDVSSIALAVGDDPLVVQVTAVPTETPTIDGARQSAKTIAATASGMLIVGATGDTIDATGNKDRFVFHSGFGAETINGFVAGTAAGDVIQFDKALFANFTTLEGAMHQSGSNVVITCDAHDQIVLDHVSIGQLSSANFLFV